MGNNIKITNQSPGFRKVSLTEPSKTYYLHIAAETDQSVFPFFLTKSTGKKSLINQLKEWCNLLEREEGVISAVVFSAILIPPGKGKLLKERMGKVTIARYDVAILIETSTSEKIENIRNSNPFKEIEAKIKRVSTHTHITAATNVKRIAPVDHSRQGVFLFNYFYADDAAQNIEVWEYTAGWFQQETGLDNSTLLLPLDKKSSYSIINHCRWDKMSDVLPSLLFKKSFHSYVLGNFYANNVAAMPVLYKLA